MSQNFNSQEKQRDPNARFITTNRRKMSEYDLLKMTGNSTYRLKIQQGLISEPLKIGKNLAMFIDKEIDLEFKSKKFESLHKQISKINLHKNLESIADYDYPMDTDLKFETSHNFFKKNIEFFDQETIILAKNNLYAFLNFKNKKSSDSDILELGDGIEISSVEKIQGDNTLIFGDIQGGITLVDVDYLKKWKDSDGIINQLNSRNLEGACYSIAQNSSNFNPSVIVAGVGEYFALFDVRKKQSLVKQKKFHSDDVIQVFFDFNNILTNSVDGKISHWDLRSMDYCVNSCKKFEESDWIDLLPRTETFLLSSNQRKYQSEKNSQIVSFVDFSSSEFETKSTLRLSKKNKKLINKIKYDQNNRLLFVSLRNSSSVVEIFKLGYGMTEFNFFGNLVSYREENDVEFNQENYCFDLVVNENFIGGLFNSKDTEAGVHDFRGHVGVWELEQRKVKKRKSRGMEEEMFEDIGFSAINLR